MTRKKRQNYLSPMTRKKRQGGRQDSARCYLVQDGKRKEILLGVWGSPEAKAMYDKLVAEFYVPEAFNNSTPSPNDISLAFLFDRFLAELENRPDSATKTSDLCHCSCVIRYVMDIYPDILVSQFNCSCYRNIRQHLVSIAPKTVYCDDGVYKKGKRIGQPKKRLVKKPWSRNYVVKLMGYFRKILHWGVAHDMVECSIVDRLKYVEPLNAPNLEVRTPRQDVPDEVIKATLPYLTSVVRDMVIIQRGNGLRPSEVCNIQVKDIDTTGDQWSLAKKGKTTGKTGIPLVIFFSQSEQEILLRRMAGKKPDDYIFTPEESEQERQEERKEKRKTKHTPSSLAAMRERAKRPPTFNPCYNASSYYHAIQYAIKRANRDGVEIPHWTPYQIRHTAVTEVAYRNDRQTAAFLAGHMHVSTTNRYAHEMVKVKADLAKKRTVYK